MLFGLNRIPWGRGWRIYGVPIIQRHRRSTIRISEFLNLRSTVWSNPLGINHPVILCTWRAGAVIEIGKGFGMTGGAICAAERIMIGENVNIGANSTIIDTDFHPIDHDLRRKSPQAVETSPVVIGDEVFIGMNCLILKGVTIGNYSVVGAGSVVTRDIPPGVIVAGNPAKEIRKL